MVAHEDVELRGRDGLRGSLVVDAVEEEEGVPLVLIDLRALVSLVQAVFHRQRMQAEVVLHHVCILGGDAVQMDPRHPIPLVERAQDVTVRAQLPLIARGVTVNGDIGVHGTSLTSHRTTLDRRGHLRAIAGGCLGADCPAPHVGPRDVD